MQTITDTHDNTDLENGKWPLPDGWEWTTLGEATNPERERLSPSSYPDLPFIGMDDIESQSMRLLSIKSSADMKSSAEHFRPDDVLYGSLRPYLNKVYRPHFEGLASAEFIVFRNTPNLESRYLQYFLNQWSFVEFINRQNTGDRPRVKFNQMEDHPFPLPPLPEQERIVAEIEKQFTRLDTAVAALKRVQAGLERYKASVLKAAVEGRLVPQDPDAEPASELLARILVERRTQWEVAHPGKKYVEPQGPDTAELGELPEGWVWATVEQVGEQRLGKMLDREKNLGEEHLYLRNANVRWFAFDLRDLLTMRVQENQLENVTVQNGDLVICEGGEPGRSAVWERDKSMVIQKALHRFRPYEGVASWYIAFVLASDAQTGRLARAFTGSTIKHFTGESLRSYVIPLPPTCIQQMIVAEVDRLLTIIEASSQDAATSLARADRLRQAILQKAFRGELVH